MVSEKKLIKIVKFRSMVKDAKSNKYNLAEKYMKNGYLDIPLTAEVFTPYGRFLEKYTVSGVASSFCSFVWLY